MGFGSYDESEQKDQSVDADDSEGVEMKEEDHEGEVTFETDSSTEDLVDRLGEMREDEDDSDEN